ncbi:hypothetical protein VNO77_38837 [Canavalia gladiata]|uniref:Uncharacterized protein n=1 Tax=Canavalia gladiata TaxID=3824 RepID=A0AAN9K9Z9_CANGL
MSSPYMALMVPQLGILRMAQLVRLDTLDGACDLHMMGLREYFTKIGLWLLPSSWSWWPGRSGVPWEAAFSIPRTCYGWSLGNLSRVLQDHMRPMAFHVVCGLHNGPGSKNERLHGVLVTLHGVGVRC